MSIEVIRASARRIIELANDLPESKSHDFIVEAATILKLTEQSGGEEQVDDEDS